MLTFLADLTPTAAIFLAISLFSASLVPFFLLINADFARPARAAGAVLAEAWTQTALTALAALLILTIPTGDHR